MLATRLRFSTPAEALRDELREAATFTSLRFEFDRDPSPLTIGIEEVEWPTLLFFVGLFVLVGALVEVGVIAIVGRAVLSVTAERPELTALVVLWLSALMSAIVDNIPYTTAMVPLLQELAREGASIEASIWALALGATSAATRPSSALPPTWSSRA